MQENNREVKLLLKIFSELITDYPDHTDATPVFVNFLRLLVKFYPANPELPLNEIMAVIQKYKPIIFELLEEKAQYDINLQYLTVTSKPTDK